MVWHNGHGAVCVLGTPAMHARTARLRIRRHGEKVQHCSVRTSQLVIFLCQWKIYIKTKTIIPRTYVDKSSYKKHCIYIGYCFNVCVCVCVCVCWTTVVWSRFFFRGNPNNNKGSSWCFPGKDWTTCCSCRKRWRFFILNSSIYSTQTKCHQFRGQWYSLRQYRLLL